MSKSARKTNVMEIRRSPAKSRSNSRGTLDVSDPAQLRALRSPLRQTLVEFLANRGPSTIVELAETMGRAPATLYRHVDLLCRVGLIVDDAPRIKPRHHERVVKAAGARLRLPIDAADAASKSAIADIIASDLRTAERSFRVAIVEGVGTTSGSDRNTRAMSTFGWLTAVELRRVNRLIDDAYKIVNGKQPRDGAVFVGLSIVMSPGPTSRSIGQ